MINNIAMTPLTTATKTPVQEFYRGQTVFITGGSGFMGKVLIEKLLYACPDLVEVFVLLRPKRGKSIEARLDDMFKLPVCVIFSVSFSESCVERIQKTYK